MRLYIGTGAEGLKPEGYTTLDIDPSNKPDIVANAAELSMIKNGTCDEVYASHVLEHFPWPYVMNTLAEWTRVLKPGGIIRISVPDMALLAKMLSDGNNIWHVMGCIYGGHWATPGGPQGHHFGYTWSMLVDMLTLLGFDDFKHWNTTFREAANGWIFLQNGERVALSTNIEGVKQTPPILDIKDMVERIRHYNILQPLSYSVREMLGKDMPASIGKAHEAELIQHLHYKLLEKNSQNPEPHSRGAISQFFERLGL